MVYEHTKYVEHLTTWYKPLTDITAAGTTFAVLTTIENAEGLLEIGSQIGQAAFIAVDDAIVSREYNSARQPVDTAAFAMLIVHKVEAGNAASLEQAQTWVKEAFDQITLLLMYEDRVGPHLLPGSLQPPITATHIGYVMDMWGILVTYTISEPVFQCLKLQSWQQL